VRIEEIVWLDVIIDKLAAKHSVETEEGGEVLSNNPRFRFVESGTRAGEGVYMASGQTNSGRYLSVLFIHKTTGDALILSARDMSSWERKRYERK
jgi:uncharacterized DUF497 family protein